MSTVPKVDSAPLNLAVGGDREEIVRQVMQDLRAYERVRVLAHQQLSAQLALERTHAQHTAKQFQTQAAAVAARGEFTQQMAFVYRNPVEAVRRFEEAARTEGLKAVDTLAIRPEAFGTLRRQERAPIWGIIPRVGDEMPARQAAHQAAVRAVAMLQHQGEARVAPLATTALREGQKTVETIASELRTLPAKANLERGIDAAVRQLVPNELKQLQKVLSPAQSMLLNAMQKSIRKVIMGGEGREW